MHSPDKPVATAAENAQDTLRKGSMLIRCNTTVRFTSMQDLVQYRLEHAWYEMVILLASIVTYPLQRGHSIVVAKLLLVGKRLPEATTVTAFDSYDYDDERKDYRMSYAAGMHSFESVWKKWTQEKPYWDDDSPVVITQQLQTVGDAGDLFHTEAIPCSGNNLMRFIYLHQALNALCNYRPRIENNAALDVLTDRFRGYLAKLVLAQQNAATFTE